MRKRIIKINNIRIQNFLGERGIKPVEEDYYTEAAFYIESRELISLLDFYDIKYYIIPNRR